MYNESEVATPPASVQARTPIDEVLVDGAALEQAIGNARQTLLNLQSDAGYWLFELEADCTIPAEYIMMMHFSGEIDETLQAKIARYLCAHQNEDGGYPLYTGGEGDISCSVKVYFALKLAGDAPDLPHMQKTRQFILERGGAARANVFTRIALAMFEQIPWRGVPYIPVEIMHLPKWFPFHLDKVSYWSRTVMVPLFILCTLRAKAKNPHKVDILELFTVHPDEEKHYFCNRTLLKKVFLALDHMGRAIDPFIPKRMRQSAMVKARDWFIPRLNGEDGLGAIFPAMVNAYEAMLLLGMSPEDERVRTAKIAIDKLLVIRDDDAYCQPCLSPVWDTGLSALALQQSDFDGTRDAVKRAFDWLASKQLRDEPGDWRISRPHLRGGGWPFQFANDYYPDVDDTAVVAYAMACANDPAYDEAVHLAARWIVGMQSSNGGFGAFDADNTYYYLNEIPFADHGALLDPPTVDVSARCAMLLARLARHHEEYRQPLQRCIDYIRSGQEADGSWFGRWGTNFIYGTWSVLIALEEIGLPKEDPMYINAVKWLKRVQREDGGWGESNYSYHDDSTRGQFHTSTAFQTAWALLGLMAAGEVESDAVKNGVDYLLRTQTRQGVWNDPWFTAPGFPRVFYLKYHGYDKFFPLWALARFRTVRSSR